MSEKKDAQVKEAIQHLAGDFLAREASKQSLITVTRVETSIDRKYATIFISVLPESAEKTALAFCKRERSAFRQYVIKKSSLHFPPSFDFEIDFGEKNRQRIDDLTRKN